MGHNYISNGQSLNSPGGGGGGEICKHRPALPLGLRSGSGTKKATRRGDGIVTSQLQQMPGRPEQTLCLHASTPSFLFCTQSSLSPVPVRCTHKAGFHPSTAREVLIHKTLPEPFPSEPPSTCTGLVYAAWVSSPTPPKCPDKVLKSPRASHKAGDVPAKAPRWGRGVLQTPPSEVFPGSDPQKVQR